LLLTWHAQNMTLQMGMLVEGHNKKQQKLMTSRLIRFMTKIFKFFMKNE